MKTALCCKGRMSLKEWRRHRWARECPEAEWWWARHEANREGLIGVRLTVAILEFVWLCAGWTREAPTGQKQ